MIRRLALIAIFASACGGDDGVSLESFPERAVDNFCDNAVDCGLFPDVQTCLDTQELLDLEQQLADAEAGLLDPDKDALAECASVTQGCDRNFNTTPESRERIQACIDAVAGTLADGEVCTAPSQCAGGVCSRADDCDPSDTCCAGTCATGSLPLAATGEDCLFINCDVGLYCAFEIDGQNFSLICRAQVAAGGTCTSADSCADGNWCNSVDAETAGTCMAVAGPGDGCEGTSVTRNNGCVDFTTYCDAGTSTCDPRPEAGEACSAEIPCLLYAYCDGGTCRTRPLEGESCDAESGPSCLGDLDCLESGVCGFQTGDPGPICTL